MKGFIRFGALAVIAMLVWTAAASAAVRINGISLSPRFLLDLYTAYQQGQSSLAVAAQQIFQMLVQSDQQLPAGMQFKIEIVDRGTWVARAEPFTTEQLLAGLNRVPASQIHADSIILSFNSAYNFSGNPLEGQIMPMGTYQVVFTPTSPAGQPYVANLALFTPQSALNAPPIAVFPKDVEITTVLPNFSWTPVAKAAYYRLAVGPDRNPEVNTYWKSDHLQSTQALYPASARALDNGKTFYWQVQAFDGFGKPVGGVDGKSQPAWFRINSSARATTAVSPAEVDAALRTAVSQPAIFDALKGYRPAAVATTSQDPAGLLRQLKDGTAKVISAQVE